MKSLLSLKQVIDNDRQLIAVEMKFPQVFQVFELFFIEVFKLEREREREIRLNFVEDASFCFVASWQAV